MTCRKYIPKRVLYRARPCHLWLPITPDLHRVKRQNHQFASSQLVALLGRYSTIRRASGIRRAKKCRFTLPKIGKKKTNCKISSERLALSQWRACKTPQAMPWIDPAIFRFQTCIPAQRITIGLRSHRNTVGSTRYKSLFLGIYLTVADMANSWENFQSQWISTLCILLRETACKCSTTLLP